MDKKGFFLPTIMIFISLFTILLVSIIYENFTYMSLVNSYEQEVYFEEALLDAKQYIIEYIKYDDNFVTTCNQKEYLKEADYFKISVIPHCILDDKTSVLLKNLDLRLKDQKEFEIEQDKYEKIEKALQFISKKEVLIFNKVYEINKKIDNLIKESKKLKVLKKGIVKKFDNVTYPYTIFNTTIILQESTHNFMYIYNYEDVSKNTIFYV